MFTPLPSSYYGFVSLGLFCLLSPLLLRPIHAIPRRANQPWSIILCKFRGNQFEPHDRQWFVDWLIGNGKNGTIAQFFDDVSNGLYTITDSNVFGWYEIPWTKGDIEQLAKIDPVLDAHEDISLKKYYKTKELCIAVARNQGASLHERKITIINDDHTAVFCKENGVLLTPKFLMSSALAHEMTHSFFVGHSYSDKNIKVFPYSAMGEYDDKYDLMSTANALMHDTSFGLAGPGLNGPHLDYLGWLPMHRTFYFGRDGHQNYVLRLSSLSVPHEKTADWLMIYIPYDKDNPGNFYTVEYRTPVSNDEGIGRGSVVIHRVKNRDGVYFSYIVTHHEYYELAEGTEWIDFFEQTNEGGFRYIRVRVEKIFTNQNIVDVRITSTFNHTECSSSELKTLLPPHGYLCLPRQNLTATISPQHIEQHRRRSNFFADMKTWGLNSCNDGYVWRGLDQYDYVCVTKPRRIEAARESGWDGLQRDDTTTQCTPNFLERQAFHGDKMCVTPEERARILAENAEAKNRIKYYKFFNGKDSVEE
uniref:Uncharacterized protein n=2 Tax=Plectus sambesii TaxID=2011161 RepID=A0A914X7S6_9BILA